MGGFFQGLVSQIGPSLDAKWEQEANEKAEQHRMERKAHWDSYANVAQQLEGLKRKQSDGTATDADLKSAADLSSQLKYEMQWLQTKSKGQQDVFTKLAQVTRGMLSRKSQQQGQQPQPQQPDQSQQQPITAPGGLTPRAAQYGGTPTPSSQLPAADKRLPLPGSFERTMAYAKGPTEMQQRLQAYNEATADIDQRISSGQIGKDEGEQLKLESYQSLVLGTKGGALLGGKTTDVVLEMKDGTKQGAIRSQDGRFYDYAHQLIDPAKIKGPAPKPSNARAIEAMGDYTNLDDAKKLQSATGQKYYNADSPDFEQPQEIDLSKIPEHMVLQAINYPGGVRRYVPRNINDKEVTINGVKYAVNPSQVQGLVPSPGNPGTGTALGPAQAATETLSPANTIQNGQLVQTPGVRRQVPAGIPGRPTLGAASEIAPNLPGGANYRTPPTVGGAPTAPAAGGARPAPAAGPGHLQGRTVQGTPQGQYIRQLQRFTAVNEGVTQMFGDPKNPNLKPLASYADLADDKGSQQRLGQALRLALDGFNQSVGGPEAHAEAKGVGVTTGGLGTWFANRIGMPATLADQQTKMMQDAVNALTPREREAFGAIMSSYSTIVGLRTLTGASAAEFAVKAIEREMPAIGLYTFSKAQFIDQLTRLGEVAKNGFRGLDPSLAADEKQATPKELMDQIDQTLKGLKTQKPATRKDIQRGPGGKDAGDDYIDKMRKQGVIK